MSHHGHDEFPEDLRRKLLDTASFRGALGDFPQGKLTASDEGAIQFGVTAKDGKVVLDFGTPTAWIGMEPQQAADLAMSMLKFARAAGRESGKLVHFALEI
jgi:hypothetical protein